MKRSRSHTLTLLITTTLSLLTLFGNVAFDGEVSEAPKSSAEEIDDRVEADDDDAMIGDVISIVHLNPLGVALESPHDSPLLGHGWRWCSRGPPSLSLL